MIMNNIKKFDYFLDRIQELINEAKNQLKNKSEYKSDYKVETKFHIGDRVRYKGHACDGVITEITNTDYICGEFKLPILTQDKLELVEQKPDTIFLKFRIGDKVTNGEDTYTINFIGKDCYWVKEHDCATIPFEYQHLWKLVEQKPAWSEDDEYLLNETIQHLEELIRINKAKYCGVEVQYYQRDINFLKSLKERVQPQSKQEWSEEDDNLINYILINCMNYVKECGFVKELHNDELHEQAKIFLKSLKDRIQPKQELSGKDKCMLNNIIDTLKPLSQTTHSGYAINSMIDWLKEKYT